MKKHLGFFAFGALLGCASANAQTNTLPAISINGPDSSLIESGFAFSWPDASAVQPLDGEMLTPLRQTEPAPFTGLLLSPPAIARIAATTRTDREICRVVAETQYNLLLAQANRDLALAANNHRLNVETAQIRINRLNSDILELTTSRSNYSILTYVTIAGGIVLGGLFGFVLGVVTR